MGWLWCESRTSVLFTLFTMLEGTEVLASSRVNGEKMGQGLWPKTELEKVNKSFLRAAYRAAGGRRRLQDLKGKSSAGRYRFSECLLDLEAGPSFPPGKWRPP